MFILSENPNGAKLKIPGICLASGPGLSGPGLFGPGAELV
jgi:hypothetical protein